jgi:hypothetical protein
MVIFQFAFCVSVPGDTHHIFRSNFPTPWVVLCLPAKKVVLVFVKAQKFAGG